MKRYETIFFRDQTNVMSQVKIGQKLVGKPEIRVKTVYPPNWDPSSTSSFAEAAKAWRQN
jgi:hypothetical protein